MAANLGFVMYAAQRCTHEFAIHGACDRAPERGLAHAGRADEAQNRRLAFRVELVHGQVLEDTALDLVEPVMVFVENLARFVDIDTVFRQLRPRQLGHEFEIGAHHRVFGRRIGHTRQPAQFAVGLLGSFFRQVGLVERFAQAIDLFGHGFVFAEFTLDRAHLFAQHGLALMLAHALLGLLVDLAR